MITGYVGTYTQKDSQGIYQFVFDLDAGKFIKSNVFAKVKSSKYIACRDGKIFSVFEENGQAGVCVFDGGGIAIASVLFEKRTSCFILVEGDYIYTANYHEGTISKLSWINNKLEWLKTVKIKEFAGCHQVILWNEFVMVPCLKLDQAILFDQELRKKGSISFKKGTGPRHGILSKDATLLYMVGELSNELITLSLEENRWTEKHRVSLLPPEQGNVQGSAAIRMSEDGNTLFISTRFANIVTTFDISKEIPTVRQFVSTNGDHPRDILNIGFDKYLLVANRMEDQLVAFAIEDGEIKDEVSTVTIPECVCIVV